MYDFETERGLERLARQDVFHLHFHVVPRYRDDDFDRARYEPLSPAIRKEQALRLKAVIACASS